MTEDHDAVVDDRGPGGGAGGQPGSDNAPPATHATGEPGPDPGAIPLGEDAVGLHVIPDQASEQEAAATTPGGAAPAADDETGADAEPDAPNPEEELLEEVDLSEIEDVGRLHDIAIDMQEQIDDLLRERDEHLDHLRRMQAEFENFRKRTIREKTDLVGRANAGLVEALLPVLDSFEMALQTSSPDDPMHAGLSAVCAQLIEVLGKEGLERLEPADGDAFDPETMQPVAHQPGDGGEGPVVSGLLRPGYRLKGSLLRASMVEVRG